MSAGRVDDDSAEAEVRQLDLPFVGSQDVLGLQIAMVDPIFVHVPHPFCDLEHDLAVLCHLQPAFSSDVFPQVFIQVLEH